MCTISMQPGHTLYGPPTVQTTTFWPRDRGRWSCLTGGLWQQVKTTVKSSVLAKLALNCRRSLTTVVLKHRIYCNGVWFATQFLCITFGLQWISNWNCLIWNWNWQFVSGIGIDQTELRGIDKTELTHIWLWIPLSVVKGGHNVVMRKSGRADVVMTPW